MEERLQKLMSQAGIASRRDAEAYITSGRVTVNGKPASLGDKADPARDDIRVDGTPLKIQTERTYVMVNKPMHVVTAVTRQSQEQRPVVRDMVPLKGHLFPVGRLDADSEGLVLLTDDGDLAEKMTHPRYEHPKTYEVTVYGSISDESLLKWQRGITLDDGPTQPAKVRVISRSNEITQLEVIMREGRKRQIRRIASLLGHPVSRLVRTHIGGLALGKLRPGDWRELSANEVAMLQKAAGSPPRKRRRSTIPPPAARNTRPANKPTGDRDTSADGDEAPKAAGGRRPSRPSKPPSRYPDKTDGKTTTKRGSRPAPRARRAPLGRRAQRTTDADSREAQGSGARRPTTGRAASSRPSSSSRAPLSRNSSERPSSGRPSSDRPSSGRLSSGRPASGRPALGRPSSGRTSSRPASGGTSSSRTPSDRPSSGRTSSRPSSGRPSSGRPASSGRTSTRSSTRPTSSRPASGRPASSRPSSRSNRSSKRERGSRDDE